MSNTKKSETSKLFVIVSVVLIIGLAIGGFIGHSYKSSYQAPTTFSTTTFQTTTVQTTIPQSVSSSSVTTTIPQNTTIVSTLYSNKTIHISAPEYNTAGYNYVTGCYWIDGYYNFSIIVPYTGYIIFNETNNGIPTNFTEGYFSVAFSTEKPRYVNVSSYNESYWCTGETFQTNIAPYTTLLPYNNQTMLIPVKNGTNYIVFYNGNANQKHGVNPFPINVTFNMKYYGFKNTNYTSVPTFNFNTTTNNIDWENILRKNSRLLII